MTYPNSFQVGERSGRTHGIPGGPEEETDGIRAKPEEFGGDQDEAGEGDRCESQQHFY